MKYAPAPAIALALVLGLSTGAMAGKLKCKAGDGTPFTVTVPQDWYGQQIQGGCVVSSKDGSEAISIAYVDAGGVNARTFAQALVKKMQITPKYTQQENNYAAFETTLKGQKVSIVIAGETGDSELQILTQKGESDELEEIFDSVKF